jgi:hypothetical protein
MLPIVITEVASYLLKILPVEKSVSRSVLKTASERLANTKHFICSVSKGTVLSVVMKDNQEEL